MEFWSAAQLREEFEVEASFYQMKIGNQMYPCRNHAVLMRKGYTRENQPDAVVVMANPGSCRPADSYYQPSILQSDFEKAPFVRVKMDPTQYQLARLMKRLDLNVVSIVNLSDICSGNMEDFGRKLNEVEDHNVLNHSIFSDKREIERNGLLRDSKTKIIIAWGKNPKIRRLVCEALKRLPENRQLLGLSYEEPMWGYRHPYPMMKDNCIAWLEDMAEQFTNMNIQEIIAVTKEDIEVD
jgi:hypothetical protein